MLNKMKLGPKLIAGFLVVSLIAAIIGIVGIVNLKNLANADTLLYSKVTLPIGNMLKITESFQRIRINLRDLADATTAEDRVAFSNTINDLSKVTGDNAAIVEKSLLTDEGKKIFKDFMDARAVYRGHLDNIISLIKDGKADEARVIIEGEGKTAALAEQAAIDKLVNNKDEIGKKTNENNTNLANTASFATIATVLVGVIFSLILGIFLSLSITRPVNEATKLAKSIAEGDLNLVVPEIYLKRGDEIGMLSAQYKNMIGALKEKSDVVERIAENDLTVNAKVVSEKDVLGKSLVSMTGSLNEIMAQINSAVEQTASGSNQVASASQSLSQGATEQASSLEEITSSITEINSQAKQNAENALQASSLAKKAMENSEAGNKQMKELVTSMANITKSADMIKKIVKVIDDIAFQTNLLALNANVEAARAGKYGKGFAVVAEEVRNLAGRSAESVKETTAMVEEAVKNILNGNNLVEVTAKQLDEIANSANKVADLVEEIATASKEQTQGLEQINQGLGQIDQVTQGNTANAEESASAAEELAGQAQQLKAIVAQFKLSKEYAIKQVEDTSHKKAIHLNKLHDLNEKKGITANGVNFEKTKIARDNKITNPKNVIRLDDDDFGKF